MVFHTCILYASDRRNKFNAITAFNTTLLGKIYGVDIMIRVELKMFIESALKVAKRANLKEVEFDLGITFSPDGYVIVEPESNNRIKFKVRLK